MAEQQSGLERIDPRDVDECPVCGELFLTVSGHQYYEYFGSRRILTTPLCCSMTCLEAYVDELVFQRYG